MSQGLDVRKAVISYFDRIISAVQGMKVVLFDDDTKAAVSMVYTQSQILEKSVFLTSSLTQKQQVLYDGDVESEKKQREKMPHLKCLILCRPTESNVDEIVTQLDNPLYGEYHLFFTTPVHPSVLSRLAQADKNGVVKQVQEFYIDYLAVNTELFDFGIEHYCRLSRRRSEWNSSMEVNFKRSIQQMMAVLLSLRQKPTIRFQSGSDLAGLFARELYHEIYDKEAQLFDFGNAAPPSNSSGETLLLVLDRKDDPITPLLLQWTYQAMVHDLVGTGLKHNVVDLGQGWLDRNPDKDESDEKDSRSRAQKQQQRRTVVLSPSEDFYAKNMFNNYGALAGNTQRMLDEYKAKVAENKNRTSLEEMTKVVENMSEFKKIANNALKHASVVGEITRAMGDRHLMDISKLEQSIACSSDHAVHVEAVKEKIKDQNIQAEDKLRLALLYTLRYETHGGNRIPEIKQLLRTNKVTEDKVKLLDALINYAGASKRNQTNYGSGADLFSGFVTMVKGVTASNMAENLLTQHKPMLAKTLEEVRTGKLPEARFPAVTGGAPRSMPSSSPTPQGATAPPAKEVIVIILGGATYEEATFVASVNNNPAIGATTPFKVLLGGTSIHNTKSFISELGSL